jgi:hypothetical protein
MRKAAIIRRQSIRAMRTLIRRWPRDYSAKCFEVSDGIQFDELSGTPIYWTSAVYDLEADSRTAVEELREQLFVEETDWERIAKEDSIRWRHRPTRVREPQIEIKVGLRANV